MRTRTDSVSSEASISSHLSNGSLDSDQDTFESLNFDRRKVEPLSPDDTPIVTTVFMGVGFMMFFDAITRCARKEYYMMTPEEHGWNIIRSIMVAYTGIVLGILQKGVEDLFRSKDV